MKKSFIEKVESFLSKDIDKKTKYKDVLEQLEKKISKLEGKEDKESLQELKSIEKLKKKTILILDSLK